MTPKQQRFIAEYLIDLNATQAAIRAGYSERTAKQIGHENLTKPDVAAAVAARQGSRADKLDLSAEKVLRDLEDVRAAAFSDGQYASVVRAIELRGKHLGMFIERADVTIKDKRSVVRAPSPAEDIDQWRNGYAPKPH